MINKMRVCHADHTFLIVKYQNKNIRKHQILGVYHELIGVPPAPEALAEELMFADDSFYIREKSKHQTGGSLVYILSPYKVSTNIS